MKVNKSLKIRIILIAIFIIGILIVADVKEGMFEIFFIKDVEAFTLLHLGIVIVTVGVVVVGVFFAYPPLRNFLQSESVKISRATALAEHQCPPPVQCCYANKGYETLWNKKCGDLGTHSLCESTAVCYWDESNPLCAGGAVPSCCARFLIME